MQLEVLTCLPFKKLKAKTTKVNAIIRSAYEAVLGLPKNTSIKKVDALGIYDTYE